MINKELRTNCYSKNPVKEKTLLHTSSMITLLESMAL